MVKRTKQKVRIRRHRRVRGKVFGTARRPRLCVFRSRQHIYAQLVDDEKRRTLVAASDLELKKSKIKNKKPKTQIKKKKTEEIKKSLTRKVSIAYEVGKLIAKKTKNLKINKVVFDRGGYKYHGRVKALAEGAREGGLKF
ncbi:MAG: 50S ribosomal protein L18 [Candidatus Paceibacterales bacterium]